MMDILEEDSSINLRKAQKIECLEQRDVERKVKLQERRDRKEINKSQTEKITYILSKYEEVTHGILSDIEKIENCENKEDGIDMLDTCYIKLDELQKLITSTVYVLNCYHMRKFQEGYQELNDKCQKLEQDLRPRKKFGFSNVKKKSIITDSKNIPNGNGTDCSKVEKISIQDVINLTEQDMGKLNGKVLYPIDDVDSIKAKVISEDLGFYNRKCEKLCIMDHKEVYKKDVVLMALDRCEVKIYGGPNTLYITSLNDCKIFCGPISTSIFIEDCKNCIFMLPCQQLRIHLTVSCKFFVHVTSRVIIEDTKDVQFAPYAWKYKDIECHFKSVNLNINVNNWNLIDDFNWLSCNTPSPNWSIMKEDDRMSIRDD